MLRAGSGGTCFNFAPRMAERLEWNPVRFAILSLIQRALLPRLMVLAPKNLAVTLTGSKFVGHLVSSLSKFVGENRSRPIREETSVQEMDAYKLRRNSLIPEKDSLFPKIFSLLICVGNCSKSGCSAVVSCC